MNKEKIEKYIIRLYEGIGIAAFIIDNCEEKIEKYPIINEIIDNVNARTAILAHALNQDLEMVKSIDNCSLLQDCIKKLVEDYPEMKKYMGKEDE